MSLKVTMAKTKSELVNKMWGFCTVLLDDGVSYGDYVEQLTYLLFLKMADEQTKLLKKKAIIPTGLNWESLKKKDGVGLAGNQVGKLKRIITVLLKDSVLVLVNPKITSFSSKKEIDDEGCLSVPDKFGPVKRSYKIKIKGLNSEGKKIKLVAEGLLARVIQHECDHLDGILFIDKLENE